MIVDRGQRVQVGNACVNPKRRERAAGPGLRAGPPRRCSRCHEPRIRLADPVRVTAISMVRNEADVIEAFVRYHAEIVDELIVVDHRSVDGTDETLRALMAEGLPLRVRAEDSPMQRQNVVMTGLMREAVVDGGADWVLPVDADEFVIAPQGSVRAELAALPATDPRA